MKTKKLSPWLLLAATFMVGIVMEVLPTSMASAAQITNRSLTLEAGAAAGGSKPSGVVKHLFSFTLPAEGALGSMKLEYCTTAAAVPNGVDCNTPTGLDTTGATLGAMNGVTWSQLKASLTDGAVNGSPYLVRTGAAPWGGGDVTVELDGVTNPQDANTTFFVRLSTYASTDATGTPVDSGSVAASTATPIELSGTMPESLVFCTGATVGLNAGSVPDCTTATSGTIAFNQLFSPSDTATATSQMAASTNAGTGYAITVNGPTLTSGSNTITALAPVGGTGGASIHGKSQFGLNLKANTSAVAASFPGNSAELAPASNGSNYLGTANTGYDTADDFRFASGETVAKSAAGTDSQIYTASYIVNVPGNQPAGTYASTLTYICTATF